MIPLKNAGPFVSHPFMDPDGANVVLLLGAPRSGTTWLAKIFDSHPQVLYRHEPDTVLRNDGLPQLVRRDEVEKYRDDAHLYLAELMNVRTLKSAGSLPLFPKTYSGSIAQYLRGGVVYSLHAADAIMRGARWAQRVPVPDLVPRVPPVRPIVVLKSVSSRGRARLFADAMPKSRIIFILRHPCGQVASTMQGISAGKFEHTVRFAAALKTEEGRSVGLTTERFAGLSPIEQCAWHWAIMNQKALNDLAGLGADRIRVLRYEDACADPERVAKELFAFSGLNWNAQTASFIQESTSGGDVTEFYGVSRDPLAAANKWRTTLSAEDQQRILAIATRVPAGEMFMSMA